jgi:hypothetical protein
MRIVRAYVSRNPEVGTIEGQAVRVTPKAKAKV